MGGTSCHITHKHRNHAQKSHADHIEGFDYTHGCSDWKQTFHLNIVTINYSFFKFIPINYRENDNPL